jgi:uncharacterized protein YsxB (DUF464 family)
MKKLSVVFVLMLILLSGCSFGEQSNSNTISKRIETKKLKTVLNKEEYITRVEINSAIEKEINTQNDGVEAVFLKNKNGVIFGFLVYGHAGYAEKGSDIVCSAISALAYNAIGGITRFTDDKNEWEEKDGYMKCYLPNLANDIGSSEAKVILNSFAASVEDIIQQYEEYLKIRYVEIKTDT